MVPSTPSRSRRRLRSQRSRRPSRALSPRRRLITVWVILIASMLGLSAKLAHLQLVRGSTLKSLANAQQEIHAVPRAARRPVIDRRGNVLAVDRVVYTIYAHPALFNQPSKAVADALSPLLEHPANDLVQRFTAQETGIKLAADVPEELAERIRRLRLDGLELIAGQQRFYPQQALMSQILGYINVDGEAQAGLEYSLQQQLLYSEADSSSLSPLLQNAAAKDSLSLQLTLDSRLQRIAQRALEATVLEHGAKRGTLIVMDARDGAILSMAVSPAYDPNRYYEANVEQFKNWAISDLYEPGSTFKPINVAIALEEDTFGPNDYVYDEGQLKYGEWTIQNADYSSVGGRGSISVTDVLRHSSNVGMVHIMETLNRQRYFEWLQTLGLGRLTGIELPAESPGQLKEQGQFVNSEVEAATTAFGQGFSLTPIQLTQLHAALANGGQLVTPHVVRGLVNPDGELQWQPQRTAPKTLFSPETTRRVVDMMEAVVESGSGEPAQVAGYRIAGKTGTAQKANEWGEYGSERITSFVGIVPAEAPRYVVLAVIDEPYGEDAYGSTVAAPLVKTVIESLVVLQAVAPPGSESGSN
ncbi:MAG: penicillin-binding protein 2 [Leptolyngbya sp. SIO4C1]|nr:penicillin-binding protein 2 [Leptolyngbya sp. SIO4C1]